MSTVTFPSPNTRQAVAEAAAWRLLGLLLERPRPGWREEIEGLAREAGQSDLQEVSAKTAEATEGIYLAWLGPGGAVSPREASYHPMRDPSSILADLKGFYDAFSYNPTLEEPLDHIATEAGFVSYLKMKEAFAQAQGDQRAVHVTESACRRFLEEHLAGFSATFAEKLVGAGELYLSVAASALLKKASATIPSGK